ncbi:hypothetical protein ACXX9E_28830 [Pseudomonas sp. GNP014]
MFKKLDGVAGDCRVLRAARHFPCPAVPTSVHVFASDPERGRII